MGGRFLFVSLLLILLAFEGAEAAFGKGRGRPPLQLDQELKCSACELIVDRVHEALSETDTKATIKIGHRLQSGTRPTDGGGKHISYARSELHVLEVLDELCEPLEKLDAVQTNPDGKRIFVEVNKRPKGSEKSTLQMRGGEGQAVSDLCYSLIEKREDELTDIIKNHDYDNLEAETLRESICKKLTGLCIDDESPTDNNAGDDDDAVEDRKQKKGRKKKKKKAKKSKKEVKNEL